MSTYRGPRQGRWRHTKVVKERDPSLINLPFPLPSIPLLTPLLSPLISGSDPSSPKSPSSSSSSEDAPQPTSTTPQASSTPASGSGGSSGSSGSGSGGGGGSSGSGGSGSEGSGSGSGGNGSSGSGSSGSGGSSAGGSSSGGSNGGQGSGGDGNSSGSEGSSGSSSVSSAGIGSGSSSGGSGGQSGSSPSSGSSANPGSNSSSQSSLGLGGASVGSGASHSSQTAGSTGIQLAAAGGPGASSTAGPGSSDGTVINAQGNAAVSGTDSSTPSTSGAHESSYTGVYVSFATGSSGTATVLYSHGVPISTATGNINYSGSPWVTTTGPSSAGSGSSSSAKSSSTSGHGLAAGVIAAIAVLVFLLCFICMFCMFRRRSISKRLSTRRHWMFGSKYGGTGTGGGISNASYFAAHPNSPRSSVQSSTSSFGTAYDRGHISPMEQVPSIHPVTSVTPSPSVQSSVTHVWPSNLSGSLSGTLNTPPVAATLDSSPLPTIRSPDRATHRLSSGSNKSGHSVESVSSTAQFLVFPPTVASRSGGDLPSPISPMSVRPFSPSEIWSFPKPPKNSGRHESQLSPLSAKAFDSPSSELEPAHECGEESTENPFADSASIETHTTETFASVDAETALHFETVETIRRAFVPTMRDEMAVSPGARVRMLRRFSDGWALAEGVETGTRGLIPIDCLRDVEQDLPTFLAAKRLSSYPPPIPTFSDA